MVNGPVELLVLEFPGERPDDSAVVEVRQVIEQGLVTVLDLLYVVRHDDGRIEVVDLPDPAAFGLIGDAAKTFELVSEEDAADVGSSIQPGSCAVVIVYEQTWARQVTAALAASGGEVALHVQVPPEVVAAAMTSATS